MRRATFILLLVVQIHSDSTKHQRAKIFVSNIDLDTNRKRNVDPEVQLDISPPPRKSGFTTKAPDYGDYEDYELTVKPEFSTVSTSTTPKSNEEIRDELSRLMSDLHREELILTTPTSIQADPIVGNMSMFFGDDVEGSADMEDMLNLTETRTTLLQEVDSVPITLKPDLFEHLDYDLNNHSNTKKPKVPVKIDRLEKYKKAKLHGGAVEKPKKPVTPSTTPSTPKPQTARKPNGRRKYLRKLTKLDRLKKVKFLNQRPPAHHRMRLRKVIRKPETGALRLKIVGSDGVVTPKPTTIPAKLNQIDSKTKRSDRREKREANDSDNDSDDDWDTVPIETHIIESIPYEPPPAWHLLDRKRTQVEPSPLISELDEEDEEDEDGEGPVFVKLQENPLKMKPRYVTLENFPLPKAKKPTMLNLLIGDFRPPFQHQWS